jgi:hypothetical protein
VPAGAKESVSRSLTVPFRVTWQIASGRTRDVLSGRRYSPGLLLVLPILASHAWNAFSGEEMLTLRGHTSSVWSVSFSPDSTLIVSRDDQGDVMVWDASLGIRVPEEPPAGGWVRQSDISPTVRLFHGYSSDGSFLLVRLNPEVARRLWFEAAARRKVHAPASHEQNAAKAEGNENWFAARFHLHRLSKVKPDEPDIQSRLKHAEDMLNSKKT